MPCQFCAQIQFSGDDISPTLPGCWRYKLKTDPIIDEIHQIRARYAAQFNFDLDAMFADLKAKEQYSGRQIIVRKPKPLETHRLE